MYKRQNQEVVASIGKTNQAIKEGWEKGNEAIANAMGQINDRVKSGFERTNEAVANGVTQLNEAIKQGFEDANETISEWAGDMEQAGKDAGEGLAKGLEQAVGNVVQVATKMAESAMDAIKQTLGISSPSVVLRDEVGLMMGEGMAEGILASASQVTDAMRRTAGAAVNAGRGVGLGNAVAGAARGGAPMQLQLKVSGGSDSAMGTAIAKLARTGQLKITANAVKR